MITPRIQRPPKGRRAQRSRPCSARGSRLARELLRSAPPALQKALR